MLVGFAVVHSLALLGFTILDAPWKERLWVGCATLWFFWPIVLVLHPGRSVRRLLVSLPLILILTLPSLRMYDSMAPFVFGWPEGLSPNPLSAAKWTRAYLAGRAEAKADLRQGHLVIEEFGFGAGSGHRFGIFRDRYRIELRATAQCVVDAAIEGRTAGYNSVSKPEIARRYGPNTIQEVTDEGCALDAEGTARREQHAKDLAKAISISPNKGNVSLTTVRLYVRESGSDEDPDPEEMAKVTEVVQWVENLFAAAVPEDAPPCQSHVSAAMSPTAPPKLEIVSSLSTPRPLHMQVYHQLEAPPDVRSAKDISITMDFELGRSSEPPRT